MNRKLEKKIEDAAAKYSPYDGRVQMAFFVGAQSPEAKALHTQGLYTEEEVKALLLKITHAVAGYINEAESGKATQFIVNDWFEQNKTK